MFIVSVFWSHFRLFCSTSLRELSYAILSVFTNVLVGLCGLCSKEYITNSSTFLFSLSHLLLLVLCSHFRLCCWTSLGEVMVGTRLFINASYYLFGKEYVTNSSTFLFSLFMCIVSDILVTFQPFLQLTLREVLMRSCLCLLLPLNVIAVKSILSFFSNLYALFLVLCSHFRLCYGTSLREVV